MSLLADPGRLPGDAAAALQRAQDAGVVIETHLPPTGPFDLAIDALLGLGISRPPTGVLAQAIGALDAGAAPVLAIDLPSGLDADRGSAFVPCVRARWTLTLLTIKPGLFTADGRDHAGEVWFDPLGTNAQARPPSALLGADWPQLRPQRRHADHKGRFGDLWVVGGAAGMQGAALLAARAALHAGAGRVFVHLLAATSGHDALQPELMLRAEPPRIEALPAATVVCGCGGGSAVRHVLPALLQHAGRLLLDADALNAVAADPALARPLAREPRPRETLLTPHPLEAARLLGCSSADMQADRLRCAREIAERFASIVLLKGSGSVIAAPAAAGLPSINPSGNAALASAGTGDVLAGWIGGLWSQGLSAHGAARLGCYRHGAAADAWRAARDHDGPLPASDLIARLAG